MRIIKKNEIEYIKKCKLCKSVFAYKSSEIHEPLYATVKCPVCGKYNKPSILDKKVK